MKCMKIFGCVLLAVLFVSAVPYTAEAGSVKVYPHQFKPVEPTDPNISQTPSSLFGNAGSARYYAVVNLPVGKRVTRLVLFQSSPQGTDYTEATLWRFEFGPANPYQRCMATIEAMENTGQEAVAYDTTAIDYQKVKSGFRYWVQVWVGQNNWVHGVKVVYE